MTKPIVVQLTRAVGTYAAGTVLGFDSLTKANRTLGDDSYRVLSYQDGTPYEPPKSKTDRAQPSADAAVVTSKDL